MNANTAKALFGGLLPFITNPVTLAIVGIGAVGITVYGILSDDKKEQSNEHKPSDTVPNGSKSFPKPFKRSYSTAPDTVRKPLETVETTVTQTVKSTAEEPFATDGNGESHDTSEEPSLLSEEKDKKEMIRQAMSELGKRSAAARAKKMCIS